MSDIFLIVCISAERDQLQWSPVTPLWLDEKEALRHAQVLQDNADDHAAPVQYVVWTLPLPQEQLVEVAPPEPGSLELPGLDAETVGEHKVPLRILIVLDELQRAGVYLGDYPETLHWLHRWIKDGEVKATSNDYQWLAMHKEVYFAEVLLALDAFAPNFADPWLGKEE